MSTGTVTIAAAVPYLGELFQSSKRPNNLLRLVGGIQGGIIESTAKEFPIGAFFNLRAPSQPANLEGQNAPAAQYRALTQTTNVIQIFHEAVQLTYLAQSDKAVSGVVPIPQGTAQGQVQNPRSTAFQVAAAIDTIAQDLNFSCVQGVFANPADPSGTALKTRGLMTAITTTSIDNSADTGVDAAKYKGYVEALIKAVMQQTGYNPDDTWTIMAGVNEYANIQAAYESKTTPPYDREIAGLKVRQIYTRFGILNLAIEPDMPDQYFTVCNLGMCGIVGLPVPNKGILFEEPLYKQGSADQTQIYGQLGFDHGPEWMHGKARVPAGVSL